MMCRVVSMSVPAQKDGLATSTVSNGFGTILNQLHGKKPLESPESLYVTDMAVILQENSLISA